MALENPLDNIPVEKINPEAAVQQLSKTNKGAYVIILVVWTIILFVCSIGIIVYAANSGNTQRDKDDTYWKPKVADEHQQFLECDSSKQLLYGYIRVLQDSLIHYQAFSHFNTTHGKKTIIITPKNIEQ